MKTPHILIIFQKYLLQSQCQIGCQFHNKTRFFFKKLMLKPSELDANSHIKFARMAVI